MPYVYTLKVCVISNNRCRCGKCDVSLLQNAKECKCCVEVEGCRKALADELVLEDAVGGHCLHYTAPGLQTSCFREVVIATSSRPIFDKRLQILL